jgi:hypothetical protein
MSVKKKIRSKPLPKKPGSKQVQVDIQLNYFKQGDDLGHWLGEFKKPEKALRMHAEQMESVVEHLNNLADMIEGKKVDIYGDTHYIGLTCDKVLADKIVKADLGDYPPEEM